MYGALGMVDMPLLKGGRGDPCTLQAACPQWEAYILHTYKAGRDPEYIV